MEYNNFISETLLPDNMKLLISLINIYKFINLSRYIMWFNIKFQKMLSSEIHCGLHVIKIKRIIVKCMKEFAQ